MTATNEPQPAREEAWVLDQEALERVLHDLDRVRQAYIQDYAILRADRLEGAATAAEMDKFLRIGGNVWDGNYMSLAALLKHRASLVSHGWGPKPRVSGADLTDVLVGKWPGGTRVLRRDVIAFLRECGIEVTDD